MRLTFLGTGTSFGVPQIGCDCEVCRSEDPRDKRSRSGALLQAESGTILLDTPPELRLQLLASGVDRVDAVLYTHEHADHINGIDDLRVFSVRRRDPLPVYGPPETLARLRGSFNYIFDDDVRPYEGTSKPRLAMHAVEPGRPLRVAGVETLPLAFQHGHLRVFGYRFGGLAYITDVKAVPDAERAQLQGLDVLVLNALWWRPHPTHLSIGEAVQTARDLGARRTFLTHLTHETGHQALAAQLPPGVMPAYDGLTVEIP
ncbi:MAG TPA: MBL fold metallo-hydrolase [Gemmatimonadales bacterium]